MYFLSFISFCVFAIISLFGSVALALPVALEDSKSITQSTRSAETCADPSLTQTVYQSFWARNSMHYLGFRFGFESDNTKSQLSTVRWDDMHPAFFGWPTQQNFTVPLWQLATNDQSSMIWILGTSAQIPPVVSGFNRVIGIIAWVYDSPVCGSVPLMTADFAQFTDRYATTNAFEHDGIISSGGWVDSGVVAFVLPLNNP